MLLKNGFIIPLVERTSDEIEFKAGTIITNADVEPSTRIVRKGEKVTNRSGWNKLQLYMFVQEDVRKGEFLMADEHSKTLITTADNNEEDQYHLVATTDPNYLCARIPKWFINQYAEKSTDKVAVRYEGTSDRLVPMKNKEHYIQLGQHKDCYDTEELTRVILTIVDEVYKNDNREVVIKWIDENLS